MTTDNPTPEFWETSFQNKQEMWGPNPAKSAVLTRDLFVEQGVKTVLIPGFGYGRNAQVFMEAGMRVTGIEISQTAIVLARKHYGDAIVIHHGSVTDMPFDGERYDGVFCYGLIYLLDSGERQKLIRDCYDALLEDGHMVFTVVSKAARSYGQGTLISPDRYEQHGGVRIYFYDRAAIEAEFGGAGLVEVEEVEENFPFFLITCRRNDG